MEDVCESCASCKSQNKKMGKLNEFDIKHNDIRDIEAKVGSVLSNEENVGISKQQVCVHCYSKICSILIFKKYVSSPIQWFLAIYKVGNILLYLFQTGTIIWEPQNK